MKLILALALLTVAIEDDVPKTPAEAIALADAHPGRGVKGVFRMTVAAAGQRGGVIYLNSSMDYRAPDDLTFELTAATARALAKRLGASPDVSL